MEDPTLKTKRKTELNICKTAVLKSLFLMPKFILRQHRWFKKWSFPFKGFIVVNETWVWRAQLGTIFHARKLTMIMKIKAKIFMWHILLWHVHHNVRSKDSQSQLRFMLSCCIIYCDIFKFHLKSYHRVSHHIKILLFTAVQISTFTAWLVIREPELDSKKWKILKYINTIISYF